MEEGVSGFLVAERDLAAIAERLCQLIGHPETWTAMGRAERRRVKVEYDLERLNESLIEIYGRVARWERYALEQQGAGSADFAARETARRT